MPVAPSQPASRPPLIHFSFGQAVVLDAALLAANVLKAAGSNRGQVGGTFQLLRESVHVSLQHKLAESAPLTGSKSKSKSESAVAGTSRPLSLLAEAGRDPHLEFLLHCVRDIALVVEPFGLLANAGEGQGRGLQLHRDDVEAMAQVVGHRMPLLAGLPVHDWFTLDAAGVHGHELLQDRFLAALRAEKGWPFTSHATLHRYELHRLTARLATSHPRRHLPSTIIRSSAVAKAAASASRPGDSFSVLGASAEAGQSPAPVSRSASSPAPMIAQSA